MTISGLRFSTGWCGMTSHPCPCCKTGRRLAGKYLCRYCWFKLPASSRQALNLRDTDAMARLQMLYRKIGAGEALGTMIIPWRVDDGTS